MQHYANRLEQRPDEMTKITACDQAQQEDEGAGRRHRDREVEDAVFRPPSAQEESPKPRIQQNHGN